MGNQSSKEGGAAASRSGSVTSSLDGLQSYPSFGKSDTKESSRSFRSLRSKIPGSSRTDSPRNSVILTNGDAADKSDAGSTRSSKSGRSRLGRSDSYIATPMSDETATPLATPLAITTTPPNTTEAPPVTSASSPSAAEPQDDGRNSVPQNRGDADPAKEVHPAPVLDVVVHALPSGQSILRRPNGAEAAPVASTPSIAKDDAVVTISEIRDIDLDDYIKRLLDTAYAGKVTKAVCLKNAEIAAICHRARECFLGQPSLLELDAPVKIVGDVHGQYPDLIRMFEMCGFPPSANFLFLGDYVDRGRQSLETILLLLCYKLKYPENFFLLRGNHECANVTRVYGFYDECKRRCNVKVWKTFIDTFNALPIAAIVAGKIFCVHGGLSPALSHMDDIRNIVRPTDVPDYGLLNDLLWSDPAVMEADWEANERGVSYLFGKKVIADFLAMHDFDLVCRAHMVVEGGYEFFNERDLVTVFSAPNYCDEFDNWGAVMSVSSDLLCSFELLKPLDSAARKNHIKKGRNRRNQMLNSPPASVFPQSV